jgi:hypothetical protein
VTHGRPAGHRPILFSSGTGRLSRSLRRPGLLLAAVVAGGPLGLLPEAAGEGVRVGRHGAGRARSRGSMPRSRARSSSVYPAAGPIAGGLAASRTAGSPSPMPRSVRWPASRPGSSALATMGGGTSVSRLPARRISRSRVRSNGTVRYQNCPNACCRHARFGRSGRVMRRLGQAAGRSPVLRCQGCSGVEKAIPATTTP